MITYKHYSLICWKVLYGVNSVTEGFRRREGYRSDGTEDRQLGSIPGLALHWARRGSDIVNHKMNVASC